MAHELVDIILADGTELTCTMNTIQFIDTGSVRPIIIAYHDTGFIIWKE